MTTSSQPAPARPPSQELPRRRQKLAERAALLMILLLAAGLRLTGLDWDGYLHFHPDERFLAWVATSIEWPDSLAQAVSPHRSTINPYYWPADARSPGVVVEQDKPRRFAYGHLPLYLDVAATRLADRLGPAWSGRLPANWLLTRDLLNAAHLTEYDHLAAVGRLLTALLDVGTVLLVYLLGRQLFGAAAGLLGAAFLAFNVMHIQLAHFFAVDPYLTFFAALAVYLMVLAAGDGQRGPRLRPALGAAAVSGLAIGSKVAGIFLLIPLAFLFWRDAGRPWSRRLLRLGAAVAVALLFFLLVDPFAVLDFTCQVVTPPFRLGPFTLPALNWGSCFLENVARQSAIVSGRADIGFARQYAGTLPYLYFLEMQARWGMGPPLAVAAFGGWGWLAGRGLAWVRGRRPLPPGQALVLLWTTAFMLLTGFTFVKFMRYWQPVTPFLMVLGAAGLLALPWRRLRLAAISLTLLATALYALAFANMARQPHPWLAASAWIYAHVPPGATILSEQWDDPLPYSLAVDGSFYSAGQYQGGELTWLTGPDGADNERKLAQNLAMLASGDYLAIASNRVYGVVPRLRLRYPLSGQAHELLFAGKLGYQVVFVAGRFPQIAGIALKPDPFAWPRLAPPTEVAQYLAARPGLNGGRFDESFTVYDQPLTFILANTGHLTAEEMSALFER